MHAKSLSNDKVAYDVPIAFFIFNRPIFTRITFEAIRAVRPLKLFLIADGPRHDRAGEIDKVAQCREIVQSVNWPCEVYINFSDINMGCKRRISSGISWVFEHVDCAVILEDDCLPTSSFFSYCREMLTLYASDKRVFSISGSNFNNENKKSGHSFSRYSLMWGWATWADRWEEYILDPQDHVSVVMGTWRNHPMALVYWLLIFRNLAAGKIDTWDFQWILTVWRNNALSCRPSVNLVKNLGFGADATHTFNVSSPLGSLVASEVFDSCIIRLTPILPDPIVELSDERHWAQINLRNIFVLFFPFLSRLKAQIRSLMSDGKL
jgi:hypothetical protein